MEKGEEFMVVVSEEEAEEAMVVLAGSLPIAERGGETSRPSWLGRLTVMPLMVWPGQIRR